MLRSLVCFFFISLVLTANGQEQQRRRRMTRPFKTDTAMVHDPVMAYENGMYYIFSTGRRLQMMTSEDRRTWSVWPKSDYKVVVGRSRKVEGPYRDRSGKKMTEGGGTLVIEGDKAEFEAAGHCAVYDMPTTLLDLRPRTLFICHGYSREHHGQAILIQREIVWTKDGWPQLIK